MALKRFVSLLRRYVYPIRFSDMVPKCFYFGRPVPQLSMVACVEMNNDIYNEHIQRLTDFQKDWLSPANLQLYADTIREAGASF